MSHDSASSLPPPPTRPSMTAMVALGIVRKASHISWKGFSSVGSGCGSVGNDWISETSKWAMKKPGVALRSTTTRTAPSSCSSVAIWRISRYSPRSNRLIGGLSMVTVATPPSTPTRSFSYPS